MVGSQLVGTTLAGLSRLQRLIEHFNGLRVGVVPRLGRGHDYGSVQGDSAVFEFLDDHLHISDPESSQRDSTTLVDVYDHSFAVVSKHAVHLHHVRISRIPEYGNGAFTLLGFGPMNPIDYRVTEQFVETYEQLNDATANEVDRTIARLLAEHTGAWARQGRVVGKYGEAWIIEIRAAQADLSLYWDYLGDHLIVLIVLLEVP